MRFLMPAERGLTVAVAIATILVLTLSAVVMVPVFAQEIDTQVTIAAGGGTAPKVKCKWEQDLTPSLEDGDPTHAISGSQFLPPGVYQGKKTIQYFAVVTDAEDNGAVKLVWADVYHPDGSFKYEVPMSRIAKPPVEPVLALFDAAAAAGLVHYGPGEDYNSVRFQLEKCVADLWRGQADLDYHQPAGDYTVKVIAMDHNDNLSPELVNTFLYVPVAVCEFDFCTVNYGSVSVCKEKWVAGDKDFGTANFPTVRNVGNIACKIKIKQNDMGFGKDVTGTWNVKFDARLGSDPANGVYYNPEQEVILPNPLPNCNTEELDFSIHVIKGTGEHTGKMWLSCVPA
ncbi:MAG: hypothetical protein QXJ75_05295 [Candidatus Bathyarchaeia archaeon]